ncbi:nitroreductase family protein [Spiroplasma endosymbiont of Labia minor]|uniref:nitroreductase family protein n=1 Tax=Spiroplasma endosymbiont of Labia minor TaxID=3066305 RepID=UPI0030CE1077
MDFLHLAKKRFTTKDYVQNKMINSEDMDKLKEAVSLTPSAFGLQQARVAIFQTQEMRQKIASQFNDFNQEKIKKASACFVFIGLEVQAFLANDSELIKKRLHVIHHDQKMKKMNAIIT